MIQNIAFGNTVLRIIYFVIGFFLLPANSAFAEQAAVPAAAAVTTVNQTGSNTADVVSTAVQSTAENLNADTELIQQQPNAKSRTVTKAEKAEKAEKTASAETKVTAAKPDEPQFMGPPKPGAGLGNTAVDKLSVAGDGSKQSQKVKKLAITELQKKQQIIKSEKEKKLAIKSDKEQILAYIKQLVGLHGKLSLNENSEETLNDLLEQQHTILGKLMLRLRQTELVKLPRIEDLWQRNKLEAKIKINEEQGNKLAVRRDRVLLAYYKIQQDMRDYLQYLIKVSNDYAIVDNIINASLQKRNETSQYMQQFDEPVIEQEGAVYAQLKKNYQQLKNVYDAYYDLLTFVINNPKKIAKTHWFQQFSLLSVISFFNHVDFIKPLNYILSPFHVDAGGIIVSLLIILLIVFCYPLVLNCSSWLIDKYFTTGDDSGGYELIYREMNRPIRALLVFFSLDLASYALLYKTEYKVSLEQFVFVVYACIYVWVLSKMLDSIVVVQLNKLSRDNKDLRKELVNLGIQSGKGVILIIALAVVLNRFGISISAILSTLGIGGLAFALAAKDTLSNLFGGITILFDNVFRMGDWVKIDEVEGTVVQIGLRSTTIRTFDNALITIPNAIVSVSSVRNWNRRAVGRRIKLYVGVTYESNMDDIKHALDEIRTMLKEHPGIANPKERHVNKSKRYRFSSIEDAQGIKATQLVFMDRYNDFSIDILIYCFSKTVNWEAWLAVKEDVLFKIAAILKKNNLEFAYPTAVRLHRVEAGKTSNEKVLLGLPA